MYDIKRDPQIITSDYIKVNYLERFKDDRVGVPISLELFNEILNSLGIKFDIYSLKDHLTILDYKSLYSVQNLEKPFAMLQKDVLTVYKDPLGE